jgi:hypothetical protein
VLVARIGNRQREARLQVAVQEGDKEAEEDARSELGELHARPFNTSQPAAVYMFGRLPASVQPHLLECMAPEERTQFFPKAKSGRGALVRIIVLSPRPHRAHLDLPHRRTRLLPLEQRTRAK